MVEKIGKNLMGRKSLRRDFPGARKKLILIPKKQYILRVDEGFSDSEKAEGEDILGVFEKKEDALAHIRNVQNDVGEVRYKIEPQTVFVRPNPRRRVGGLRLEEAHREMSRR